MTKDQLRKLYLQKRLALTEAAYLTLNQQLYDNFFACVDLSFVKILHTFLPMEKQREVNTWLIIDRVRREFPHIRISIPKINSEACVIESFYFEGLHQLEKNPWGIPEPKQGIPTPVEKIDAVLVPLLTFDKKGNRVGYGRGFYDKFLATCPEKCHRIGLSFFPPEDSVDEVQPFDVPISLAVTPQGCINLPS